MMGDAFADALGPECVAPAWTQREDVHVFAGTCTFTLCKLAEFRDGGVRWCVATYPQQLQGSTEAVYTLAQRACKPNLNLQPRRPSAEEQLADSQWAVHGKGRLFWRRANWPSALPGTLQTAIRRARESGRRTLLDACCVPDARAYGPAPHTRRADAWAGQAVCSLVRTGVRCAPVSVHPFWATRVLQCEEFNVGGTLLPIDSMESVLDLYCQLRMTPRHKLNRSKNPNAD